MPLERASRIKAFASFFKSYMSIAAIVAAAIPIPVASWKLLPVYSQQKGFLTLYSSLFCFLLLAFIFSIRHRLAPRMFSGGLAGSLIAALPLVFIVATVACILTYHAILQQSILQLRNLGLMASTNDLLSKMDSTEIPYGLELAASYLGIFLFAEAAFVLMAIREYLQDVLHLDEGELLHGVKGLQDARVAPSPSTSRRGPQKSTAARPASEIRHNDD